MTDIFIRVTEMSVTASIVIGVIIVLRLFLRKAPKVFSYVLWAAALFRLLCPVSFELPSAPISSVEIPYSAQVGERNADGLFITHTDTESLHAPEYTEPQRSVSPQVTGVGEGETTPVAEAPVKREISLLAIASYIWALAVVTMACRGAFSWIRLSHTLRSAQKMGGNVYVSPAISDPFIMGIIRPKIYLPTGLSFTESGLIISHEKAHMHRGDHIAKLIMYIALCIHCFNPLVWLMFRLFERDMEMSCDEKVTANMTREQKADYSQTLLKISAKPTAAFTACFGENGTKQRIKNVLSFRKPAVWVVIVLTLAAIVVSVILCANGRKEVTQTVGEDEIIQSTDAFSAKMNVIPAGESNDEYAIDCVITNLTSDELSVDLSHYFSLCYSSNIVNPVVYGPTDEYTFAPNESKSFVFDVETALVGDNEDTKVINGSCVLEITNSDKYECYNVLEISMHIVEKNDTSLPEVSEKMETVTVPDVYKMDYREATELLNNAGLRPAFVFIFSEEEKDTVIKTIPDKGAVAGKDSYVIVHISGGPETEDFKTIYGLEAAMGKNGSIGYMNLYQPPEITNNYEHYRIEITDEEELERLYKEFYPQFGANVYSYKFYNNCTDVPIYDESCEKIVDYFTMSGVSYEPPEDDEYNDWTDTIKLIPLTEEHQRTVDISSASPDVLYSDSRNCLFSDGTGGIYLYNFENRELLLAVDFLASMELVNSGIAIEENQYGGASIYSSMTAYNDKWIYFSFETKGKEKRGGGFNGRSYYLDVINSKLTMTVASGSLYDAAVTEPIDPAEHPDAISASLAMINKRDFVYMVNSGTDEGKLPMIRLARNINGNVEYFDPFEKALIPQERKAPEEWGLSFTAEAVDNNSVKLKLTRTCDRELVTGSYFIIQKREVYGWSEPKYCVEYYLNEHCWTDEAIIIPNDSERVITEDWSGFYGELDYGEYRIGKSFRMANGEEMMLFAEFYIE